MRPFGLGELRRRAVAYEVWRAPCSGSLRAACVAGLVVALGLCVALWWPGSPPPIAAPTWARLASAAALAVGVALAARTGGFRRGGLRVQRVCLALALVGAAGLFVLALGAALVVFAWTAVALVLRAAWATLARPW